MANVERCSNHRKKEISSKRYNNSTILCKRLECRKEADQNAQETANYYLDRGMTDQFAQTFFSKRLPLKRFIDHLIENTRLDTYRPAYSGGIIHHNSSQDNSNSKGS